jgi:hypothetical protein
MPACERGNTLRWQFSMSTSMLRVVGAGVCSDVILCESRVLNGTPSVNAPGSVGCNVCSSRFLCVHALPHATDNFGVIRLEACILREYS